MRRTLLCVGVLAALPFLLPGSARQESRTRIERLEKIVLAPCCYTESVNRHSSEIAVKMRLEISNWVEQGRSDQQILDTYAERYGAKVLVDPNTLPKDYTLMVPWAIAGLAMLGTGAMLWRWRATRLVPVDDRGTPLPDLPDLDD